MWELGQSDEKILKMALRWDGEYACYGHASVAHSVDDAAHSVEDAADADDSDVSDDNGVNYAVADDAVLFWCELESH